MVMHAKFHDLLRLEWMQYCPKIELFLNLSAVKVQIQLVLFHPSFLNVLNLSFIFHQFC